MSHITLRGMLEEIIHAISSRNVLYCTKITLFIHERVYLSICCNLIIRSKHCQLICLRWKRDFSRSHTNIYFLILEAEDFFRSSVLALAKWKVLILYQLYDFKHRNDKKKKRKKKKNPHHLNFVAKTNSLPQNEGTASIIWQLRITKVSVLSKSKHCGSTLRQYHQKKVPFSFVLLLFATFSSNPPARTSLPPLHFHTEAAPTQNETSLSTLQRGLLQAWARCQQRTDAGSRLAPSRELPSPLWASRCSPDNAVTDALPRTAAPPLHRGPSLAPGRLYLPENIHQDLCAPIMKNLDQAESFKNVSGLQKHKLRNNAPQKPSSPWCF